MVRDYVGWGRRKKFRIGLRLPSNTTSLLSLASFCVGHQGSLGICSSLIFHHS